MKDREYRLLETIAENQDFTQARLAASLGIAVGSVNWYIKRLISRGYLKATRMDRTRLRYNLTAEGMEALRRNATQYAKDSLRMYRRLRNDALEMVKQLNAKGIRSVYLSGGDEVMDILRLSCIEAGINFDQEPRQWRITSNQGYYSLTETSTSSERETS